MNTLLCTIALLVGLSACGESYEISDQPLQGRVGGMPWTFSVGDTDSFLSDESSFFASLYADAGETCGFASPGGNSLILNIPTAPGDYELSLSRSMTFVVDDGDGLLNLIATDGRLVVDEITATTISGGVYGKYDGDNEIDGNFSLTICSQ